MDLDKYLKEHDKSNYNLNNIKLSFDDDFFAIRNHEPTEALAKEKHYDKIKEFANNHPEKEVVINKSVTMFDKEFSNYVITTRIVLIDKNKE